MQNKISTMKDTDIFNSECFQCYKSAGATMQLEGNSASITK